ncbi:acyl-CoA dehydrogenase family protein [Nocardia carnea]|uniref:Acyl-CoA dehydrogenase n=1 Tax=Nocardia carnea TaxID=37328 RepID=A0ABW7TKD9_9NOCA|nr:acyl-CoA dehydrogenase [Nocardia carnea]
MVAAEPDSTPGITQNLIDALAERAQAAEQLRRLPDQTLADAVASGFLEYLVPKRFGGREEKFPAILDPIRRMAHGCVSSAWTLGFYTLHNWLLALFPEQAQVEAYGSGPFLCPAALAPTGRGIPADGGITLSGRWSWATGVMGGNWIMVGALCGPDDGLYPALALLPATDITIEDVWHTEGMRATGSNDVVIRGAHVGGHRLVRSVDINSGSAPGAALHDATTYRWPLVPALALAASMPALGAAERATDIYADRLEGRILLYEGGARQQDKPMARAHLGHARVRLRALRGLLDDTVAEIESLLDAGTPVQVSVRAQARLAAAYIVRESRAIIADLLHASGASVHFTDHPMQRLKRDVDVLSGHVVFDYDTTRELAGATALGLKAPRSALL